MFLFAFLFFVDMIIKIFIFFSDYHLITMGSDQHFCLRWNNFHSNIAASFEYLRTHEDFVDVTLACEGRSLKAHKVVLSACSPYFRNLLKVRFLEKFYFYVLQFF